MYGSCLVQAQKLYFSAAVILSSKLLPPLSFPAFAQGFFFTYFRLYSGSVLMPILLFGLYTLWAWFMLPVF
jgi:membrane protease YdiL (CAAX protease family)